MEATLFSHPALPARRFLASPRTTGHKKIMKIAVARRGDNHQDHHCRGSNKIVDENMIVLRMRIKEMKALECGDGDLMTQMHWMGWEKEYFARYNKDVCEILGLLQGFLIETRPALGLGMMAFVLASVPLSTYVVILRVMEIVRGLFSP